MVEADANVWGQVGLGVVRVAAAAAPRQAGVYLFLDEREDVVYVGKASNLRQRLSQHAAPKGPGYYRDDKYDVVRRVVWEIAADEEAAFWREADLIFALRPPFNGNPDLRVVDPVVQEVRIPYIIVVELPTGRLSLTLEPAVPSTGRAYGCFPHLGKGVGSRLAVACSDGYTSLLRLLWAASDQDPRMPAAITRSAPSAFIVAAPAAILPALHRFLSGTSPRLADDLHQAASRRPDFMQPALRRDREAAHRFFAAGPRLVRARVDCGMEYVREFSTSRHTGALSASRLRQ